MSRVYVWTYHKYASGSIAGKWVDCGDFSAKEDFLEYCRQLHSDEAEPELMFQDYEDFPEAFYAESSIDERLWTDYLPLAGGEKDIYWAYLEHVSESASSSEALEAYAGTYDSPEDWAEQFLEDTGSLSEVPKSLRSYIDFASYARDAKLSGDMSFVRFSGELYAFHCI